MLILGLLAGVGLPIQTGINTKLREKTGSPYTASLVSFSVSAVFLLLLLLAAEHGVSIPFSGLLREPWWIWLGGVCGVVFLTSNILLLSKLGSAETVILPVLGQILMGLVIDHFGLFHSASIKLTPFRAGGALLVIAGAFLASASKGGGRKGAWPWRFLGIAAGMLSAAQVSINGALGKRTGSPLKAAFLSFLVGILFLGVICVVLKGKHSGGQRKSGPWWIWLGGILGGLYIWANVYLSGRIGTGATVVALLTGSISGGLLVDHFGLFRAGREAVDAKKMFAVLVMISGAVLIKLVS